MKSHNEINEFIKEDISTNKRHAESARRSAEWHEKKIEELQKKLDCIKHEPDGKMNGNWIKCKHCGYEWYSDELG